MNVRRILHPTDLSSSARAAFEHATFLARRHDAELHVVHAVTWPVGDSVYSPLLQTPEAKVLKERLFHIIYEMMQESVADYDGGKVHVEQLRAVLAPAPKILEYARENEVDLIVAGTHGRRSGQAEVLGSVATELVRRAACPVLTVRAESDDGPQEQMRDILVPIDFSEHSRNGLAHAHELAKEYGAGLHLLHVIDYQPLTNEYGFVDVASPEAPVEVEERVREGLEQTVQMLRRDGLTARLDVAHGSPAAVILQTAEADGSDMIVQASHGRTGLRRFLMGSVSEAVIRSAPCPVFTVKSFGRALTDEAPVDRNEAAS